MKVFLFYPYYWPQYKAGGPVQSLFNLCNLLRGDAACYLVSKLNDIDGSPPEIGIAPGKWTEGPNNEQVYYSDKITWSLVKKLLKEVQPDVLFINGLFNIETTLPALYYAKSLRIKTVISPRGMLQQWGLKRNSSVKKTFLFMLRLFLRNDEIWHATDNQEKKDIHTHFGKKQQVHTAPNVPRAVGTPRVLDFPQQQGKVRLVFLSLINRNKNLHLILEAVKRNPERFSLDIYGPTSDKLYWDSCTKLMGAGAQYKGPVPPWNVIDILQQFHFFVLPTEGENFGHAIFDSLSAGVPVIISKNTPWLNVDSSGAGYYLEDLTVDALLKVFGQLDQLTNLDYARFRTSSRGYAANYWRQNNYRKVYNFLLDR